MKRTIIPGTFMLAGLGLTLALTVPAQDSKPLSALATKLKWLPELDVDKRMEHDPIWFKLALLF